MPQAYVFVANAKMEANMSLESCDERQARVECTPRKTWEERWVAVASTMADFVGSWALNSGSKQQPVAWVKARGLFQPTDQVGGPQP